MDVERRPPIEDDLRWRLNALGPDARKQLLDVLSLTSEARATCIGAMYTNLRLRTLANLLIDLEEDPAARGIVITELQLLQREGP